MAKRNGYRIQPRHRGEGLRGESIGLATLHPDALYVEMGPHSVLKRLAHKIAPNLKVVTCGTAAEVDALLTVIAA